MNLLSWMKQFSICPFFLPICNRDGCLHYLQPALVFSCCKPEPSLLHAFLLLCHIISEGVFFAVKEVNLFDQGSNAKQCIFQLEQVRFTIFFLDSTRDLIYYWQFPILSWIACPVFFNLNGTVHDRLKGYLGQVHLYMWAVSWAISCSKCPIGFFYDVEDRGSWDWDLRESGCSFVKQPPHI